MHTMYSSNHCSEVYGNRHMLMGFCLLGSIAILGYDPLRVLPLAIVGNMIPVPFILLFLEPLSNALSRFQFFKRIFDKVGTALYITYTSVQCSLYCCSSIVLRLDSEE